MKSDAISGMIQGFSLIFFALLLCFPDASLEGASTGLILWYQTVLPTLLPTMILADFLLKTGADRFLIRLVQRPFSFLFGLSPSGSYCALVGFLCGYPMGAKTVAALLYDHRIDLQEARYLLAFTNQPSPMFLIGFLCLGLFSPGSLQNMEITGTFFAPLSISSMIPLVLCSVYGSAFFLSGIYRLLRRMHHHFTSISECILNISPGKALAPIHNKSADLSPLSLLESSMMSSFEVMVKIGGYMMLFSIGEVFLQTFPWIPWPILYTWVGLLEMTTGSRHIAQGIPFPWSLILCVAMVSFGGLCGLAQTANVLRGSRLNPLHYLCWKFLQGTLAAIFLILMLCMLKM